jgi:hypothetical protein
MPPFQQTNLFCRRKSASTLLCVHAGSDQALLAVLPILEAAVEIS